jgi:hypothetical protein
MRWRLNVHEAWPWEDPGVFVSSDDQYALLFAFGEGYVVSTFESNVSANFEPGIFHEFDLRSGNMRTYELYIDDQLAIEGVFSKSFISPLVGFGDVVRGGASLAEWDYFRFGVVPEPSGFLLALMALACIRRRRI